MRNKKIFISIFGFIFIVISIVIIANPKLSKLSSNNSATNLYVVNWKSIDTGLFFAEVQGPSKTEFGDYKVQIIRINPKYYEFEFMLASEHDSLELTAPEWCQKGGFIGVINAGMYHFNKSHSSVGFLKHNEHINQPSIKDGYKMVAAFGKTNDKLPEFKFYDLAANDFESIKHNYSSCFQSIRLIDECGRPVFWHTKRVKRMSIAALAIDNQGNVLYLLCRSPYSANEFIQFMQNLPFKIQSAMYLEGGPEASLFVEHNDFCIDAFGSYVSRSFAHDRNNHFWEIPNMLGFRKKLSVK